MKDGTVVGLRFGSGDELTFEGRVRVFFERVAVKTKNSPEKEYLLTFFGKKSDESAADVDTEDDGDQE